MSLESKQTWHENPTAEQPGSNPEKIPESVPIVIPNPTLPDAPVTPALPKEEPLEKPVKPKIPEKV